MPTYDFQVQLTKNADLALLNPADGSELQRFQVRGHIMKGCAEARTAAAGGDPGIAALAKQAHAQFFDTVYSFGDFYIDTISRPLSMKQNPNLADSGVEVRDDPAQEYPRTQFWSMYAIFTLDLPSFADAKFRIFNVANRQQNPIRLRCRLTQPWGEQVPLRYELLDDEVPLYPWDAALADFATVCPVTGGSPAPLAALKRDADNTSMRAAWTSKTKQWRF